jgi:hypothetical protein
MANRYGAALTAMQSAVRLEVELWQALEAQRDGETAPERAQEAHDQWLAAFEETRARLKELQSTQAELEAQGSFPSIA